MSRNSNQTSGWLDRFNNQNTVTDLLNLEHVESKNAKINEIQSDNLESKSLDVVNGEINNMSSQNAFIAALNASFINADSLSATNLYAQNFDADSISATNLYAQNFEQNVPYVYGVDDFTDYPFQVFYNPVTNALNRRKVFYKEVSVSFFTLGQIPPQDFKALNILFSPVVFDNNPIVFGTIHDSFNGSGNAHARYLTVSFKDTISTETSLFLYNTHTTSPALQNGSAILIAVYAIG